MEHTNEILAAAFMAYPNAEFKVNRHDGVWVITEIDLKHRQLELMNEASDSTDADFADCKPILTPLSEITDEHAIRVAKICNFPIEYSVELKTYIGYGIIMFHLCNVSPWGDSSRFPHHDRVKTRDFITNCRPYFFNEIHDYLRSKSYDVGFRHLPSLIEAGIAIKK